MKFRALLLLLVMSATAQAQPVDAAGPIVQPVYESTVRISMRDGVELALELFLPENSQARPTLYASGPLPLGSAGEAPDVPQTGPVSWWLDQGYNVVIAATRGTGGSGGAFEFMGREEQQDHYEVIEWIASQPWSDGQVAGLGAGYYGSSQWFMAIQNPPHLSCIAPVDAVLDPYQDWAWHMGLVNRGLLAWYESELREAWAYPESGTSRYVDFDLQRQLLEHRLPDPWWQVRTAALHLDNVEAAVFQAGSWRHGDTLWSNVLERLEELPAPAFTWVGSSDKLLQNPDFLERELLPWYQWCFSGKPRSGPALQPTLRYQVVNSQQSRASSGWPPANINYTALHATLANGAANEGRLLPEAANPGRNRTLLQSATDERSVVLRSEALLNGIDLAGPLLLQFHVSAASLDTAFEAELFEEVLQVRMPTGELVLPGLLSPELSASTIAQTTTRLELISSGRFKASQRSVIESPGAVPVDPASPSLLYPGRIYRFDLPLAPRAWHVRAGSRLVLILRQVDDPSLGHLERNDTLYHTNQYPTQLWLPLSADSRLMFRLPEEPEPELAPLTRQLFNGNSPIILLPDTATQAETSTGAENPLQNLP